MRGWTSRWSDISDLEGVVREIAGIVKRYRLTTVTGDKYSANWVRERFQAEGIRYQDPAQDKSAAYVELEPLVAQGRLELLGHPTLARELTVLERRPRPGGRPLIDHPRGGHDDYANALALAAVAALQPGSVSTVGPVAVIRARPHLASSSREWLAPRASAAARARWFREGAER
jgi:hypothetical protein